MISALSFYLLGLVPGALECSGKSHVTPEIVSGLLCPFIFTNAFMGVYRRLCHHNISESHCSMTVALFVYSFWPSDLFNSGDCHGHVSESVPWCMLELKLLRTLGADSAHGVHRRSGLTAPVSCRAESFLAGHLTIGTIGTISGRRTATARFARLPGLQPLPSPGPEQESIPNLDVQKLTFC